MCPLENSTALVMVASPSAQILSAVGHYACYRDGVDINKHGRYVLSRVEAWGRAY